MEERLQYLFQRYLQNACTRDEMEEFFSLVNQSEHDAQLREMIRHTWESLAVGAGNQTFVNEKGRLILPGAQGEPISRPAFQPGRRRLILAAAAAIFVVAVVFWVAQRPRQDDDGNAIAALTRKTTDRSESKFIVLEDSTQVWLNAASTLSYPDHFDKSKREVYLSGEAYFDVKHADKVPFVIHTGNVFTTVMGTAFNIKAYPEQADILVAVSRGKVKVSRKDGWSAFLERGQMIRVQAAGSAIPVEKKVIPEEVAAWQRGDIHYDDETMEEIVADMARVYNVTIRLRKTELKNIRISTTFKKEIGVEQALQVLTRLTDSRLELKDGVYSIQ